MAGGLRRAMVRVLRRKQLEEIALAGSAEHMVEIDYVKKNGDLVTREIRPYEIKPHRASGTLMVYATDTLHGAGNIHSFIASRVRSADELDGTFKPRWPIKLTR